MSQFLQANAKVLPFPQRGRKLAEANRAANAECCVATSYHERAIAEDVEERRRRAKPSAQSTAPKIF